MVAIHALLSAGMISFQERTFLANDMCVKVKQYGIVICTVFKCKEAIF